MVFKYLIFCFILRLIVKKTKDSAKTRRSYKLFKKIISWKLIVNLTFAARINKMCRKYRHPAPAAIRLSLPVP